MIFTQKKIIARPQYAIVTIVTLIVISVFFLHPRLKNVFFEKERIRTIDSFVAQGDSRHHVSGKDIWMFNDFFDYGYRTPPSTLLPNGPWYTDFPALSGITYDQVSLLTSPAHYSLDLIPKDNGSVKQIDMVLGLEPGLDLPSITKKTTAGVYVITKYDPIEASHANGYYFEDTTLTNKYWVNISYYQL